MSGPWNVLCVCTHNRTRSVLMAALLSQQFAARRLDVTVTSAGLEPSGHPPTPPTVRLLAQRGIDIGEHRSRALDDVAIESADLIVAAERRHVVSIAVRWPGSFARAFTLPEIVSLGEGHGPRGDDLLERWLDDVNVGRATGAAYLDTRAAGEIDDPTGRSKAAWTAAFTIVDDLTMRLATLLA